jgi:phospholipid/cholesterol/gamma-HCH transport system ATP-binding protein
MSNIAIKVENVYKSFGPKQVLKNVSLQINEGESFVLIGRSGTGKSVLIKNIIGIMKPDSGDIYINGLNTTHIKQEERIKMSLKIGMLFQGSALFDSLSVQDNVVFGVAVHNKISKEAATKLATETLEMVGLDKTILNVYPAELSGGMQKRVGLARVIAQKPRIIFFDEPTSGLDPVMSNVINDLIIKTTKYLGATSFTITHDMGSAKKIADKIAFIDKAEIVWQGTPKDINTSDNKLLHDFINGIY